MGLDAAHCFARQASTRWEPVRDPTGMTIGLLRVAPLPLPSAGIRTPRPSVRSRLSRLASALSSSATRDEAAFLLARLVTLTLTVRRSRSPALAGVPVGGLTTSAASSGCRGHQREPEDDEQAGHLRRVIVLDVVFEPAVVVSASVTTTLTVFFFLSSFLSGLAHGDLDRLGLSGGDAHDRAADLAPRLRRRLHRRSPEALLCAVAGQDEPELVVLDLRARVLQAQTRAAGAARLRLRLSVAAVHHLAGVAAAGLRDDVELVDLRLVGAAAARDGVAESVAREDRVGPTCAIGDGGAALAAEVVLARSAVHGVGPAVALDDVVTRATAKHVVVHASVDLVVAPAAVGLVAAAATLEQLRELVADKAKEAAAALEDLDVTADVVAFARGAVVRSPVERHGEGIGAAAEPQCVDAITAGDHVAADAVVVGVGAAVVLVDDVVARPAVDDVVRAAPPIRMSSPGPPLTVSGRPVVDWRISSLPSPSEIELCGNWPGV